MHWMWKKFHIVKKFLCEKHTFDECDENLTLILKCYKCDEMKKSNKIKLTHNIVTYKHNYHLYYYLQLKI